MHNEFQGQSNQSLNPMFDCNPATKHVRVPSGKRRQVLQQKALGPGGGPRAQGFRRGSVEHLRRVAAGPLLPPEQLAVRTVPEKVGAGTHHPLRSPRAVEGTHVRDRGGLPFAPVPIPASWHLLQKEPNRYAAA